mmetsp:Transcript_7843/g.23141  ORF Transcript_7843/g.23141 Transcript_7843/m.23141 type:complete len:201 (+) Transcript_7843:2299-2901(+)
MIAAGTNTTFHHSDPCLQEGPLAAGMRRIARDSTPWSTEEPLTGTKISADLIETDISGSGSSGGGDSGIDASGLQPAALQLDSRYEWPQPEWHPAVMAAAQQEHAAAQTAFAEGISSAGPTPGAHCIADSYTCPITQEVCESPVVAADGFTYEEAAIRAWLDTHDTSPLTNECMDHKRLVPNHTLKAAIRALREAGFLHT